MSTRGVVLLLIRQALPALLFWVLLEYATMKTSGPDGRADLVFGADELVNHTAVYTWASNQIAHALLGLAVGGISARVCAGYWQVFPFFFPIIKDTWDFVAYIFSPTPFAGCPVHAVVAFDSVTDTLFWAVGIFAGLILFHPREDKTARFWVRWPDGYRDGLSSEP